MYQPARTKRQTQSRATEKSRVPEASERLTERNGQIARPRPRLFAGDERRPKACPAPAASLSFPIPRHRRIPPRQSIHDDDSTRAVPAPAFPGPVRLSNSPVRKSLRSPFCPIAFLASTASTVDFFFRLPKPFQIVSLPKPCRPSVHDLQGRGPYITVSDPALQSHQRYTYRLSRVAG
jgi:hypothetical protein